MSDIGRRRSLRPRASVAVLASLASLASLGAAFLAGTYVAGTPGTAAAGGHAPGAGQPGAGQRAAFHGEPVAAESCADLLDSYIERGLELVGPYGWGYNAPIELDGPLVIEPGLAASDTRRSMSEASSGSLPAAPAAERAESSGTGTNVQEPGVDEPDVVKADDGRLFRIQDGILAAYDVTGEEVEPLSELDLGDLRNAEILLAGDTVVAIGDDGTRGEPRRYFAEPPAATTRVLSVDVSDPARPRVTATVDVDSSLVAARQHGDTIRLVTSAGLPDLDFVQPRAPRGGLGQQAALAHNQQLVRETTIADWLPTLSVDGGTVQRRAECEDVAVPTGDLGLGTTTVIGFDAADPTSWDVTALAADAPLVYVSEAHLYLGTSPTDWACWDICTPSAAPAADELGTTHLFDYELTGTGTSYVAAGEVDGRVQDRWAMDELDGTLRLAVSPTERTGNFSSVVTLRREGEELVEIGRLDKLGVNETIQSVRWFDGLAILVTFRQQDPLYTVDLTDPTAPRLMGELKIPGFSEYLHPVGTRRLIGIGQGPAGHGWGAAAALFKVTDLTDPRRLDLVTYAHGTEARAGTDPRQFTWLPSQRVALTVVARGWPGRTGWVSVLSLRDGELTNRMVEAEYGVEIEDLRLVPLPDGRVVMSTGDGAEFFDLHR
jgi:hypothetical protein